ncbi:unnamed protein product, partial [Mesorhabditis belari]|uniref:Major facilitator superfamily (MFS) profile domain-containing protein n=1 Tax=Mesorhabditis belari TaxID=2138241 RepID=A0AAF3EQ33_9BILA
MAEKRSESSIPGTNLALTALVVSLGGSANFAYHLIITNPAQEAFIQFLNGSFYEKHEERLDSNQLETLWSLIVSILYWGTIVGALLIQTLSQKLGRKHALTVVNVGQVGAIILALFAYYMNDYIIYGISRLLLGVAQAISLGIGPMYIVECSPTRCRGVISLSTGLIMQSFIVVAAIVALPKIWGNTDSWWKLYAIELIELIFVISISFFLPESPSVLQLKGQKEAAEESIQFYHGISKDEARLLLKAENRVNDARDLGLFEVFKHKSAAIGTILGCLVMFAMCFSGLVVVNAFAVEILINTGLSVDAASYANVGICVISVFGVLSAGFVVDRMGRRPLVLLGILGCSLANCAIFGFMFGFEKTQNSTLGWALVMTICLFIFLCCISIGPLCFFLVSELVDSNARPAAATWVNLVLGVTRSILLAIFLPMKIAIGASVTYILLFLPSLIFCLIVLYWKLPETKGRTFPEIRASLMGESHLSEVDE